MAPSISTVVLAGDNLGTRHRHLNTLVTDAINNGISMKIVRDIPEHSTIDRIFRIDLASKEKNVNYIIENLKDIDMLYVSRALKSKWLLDPEYRHVINPSFLEEVLYPTITTTAVSKIKHWIYTNLREAEMCEDFYRYYCEKKFDFVIKLLWRCKKEFIFKEFPKILSKMTPHYLKMLTESCPEVAEIFYEAISTNESLKSSYVDKDQLYFDSIKSLLKVDGDMYLNITEKYFRINIFKKFSAEATKHVMKHHKTRFDKKPELYSVYLLHFKTLAKYLTSQEIKILIIQLARAEYLGSWFCYKNVEPLFKQLKAEERAAFKKKVFVEKDIGDKVKEWPYPIPNPPVTEYTGAHIFDDRDIEPDSFGLTENYSCRQMSCMMKASCYRLDDYCPQVKTLLDKLFDEYRFASFEHVLFELRKKIAAESSSQNREYMMLVLVSKSGGRAESLDTLLQFLGTKHYNEPPQVRAAVIRSLVKRANAWRLPSQTWNLLLAFARGLGLDGSPPEADCVEGLHAAVLRKLLMSEDFDCNLQTAYFNNFSTFANYSLNGSEKIRIAKNLPVILLNSVKPDTDSEIAVKRFNQLLDTLDAFRINPGSYPGVIPAIVELAHKSPDSTKDVLERLFKTKVGRKELFKEYFAIFQTDASYLNALKHDTSVLDVDNFIKKLKESSLLTTRFLQKLAVYFAEPEGLSFRYLNKLLTAVALDPNILFAKPVSILAGSGLAEEILKFNSNEKKSAGYRFSSALKANAHYSRPSFDIDSFGWPQMGAKAVANKVVVCSNIKAGDYIQDLLKCRRTVRLALVLAQRVGKEGEIFASVASARPTVALKVALKYYRRRRDSYDPRVWVAIEPVLSEIDLSKKSKSRLRFSLHNIDSIAMCIKPNYCTIAFKAINKVSRDEALGMLCNVENMLPDVDEMFIENLITELLVSEFIPEKVFNDHDTIKRHSMYLRITVKFLLLSKSETEQNRKLKVIGQKFFDSMDILWNKCEKKHILEYIDEILLTLRYNKVFLDTKYVTCLPVMERVLVWMQKILPMEKWFEKYVQIHLTMLYFKSIKQSIKNSPEVFSDEKRKLKEGVEIVGHIFGKYIINEVKELMTKYFDSVLELYNGQLLQYIENYFMYGSSKTKFKVSIIKGLIEENKGSQMRLAAYFLKDLCYYLDKDVSSELCCSVKMIDDEQFKFFLYNSIYTDMS